METGTKSERTAASGSQPQNEVTERLYFETLLADIAARFVNLPIERIDEAIIDSQRRICDFLAVDRSVLWQFVEGRAPKVLPSHIHDSSDSFLPAPPVDFADTFPLVFEQILQGETFAMQCAADLETDAERDRDSFAQWGIKSCFMAPLSAGGRIIGALSFCSLHEEKNWRGEFTQRLQLVAQLFATAVSRKQAEERLASLKQFETLITEISAQFSNLPADQVDSQIEDAQRRVCECLDVDLSALWQWSADAPDTLRLTHLYSPPEGPELPPEGLDANTAFPWSLEQMSKGKTLVIYTENMPPEAARDQATRRHFGVESSVGIPLSVGTGPSIGFISFDALKAGQEWPEPIVERLQLIGQVFANALVRKQAAKKLESNRKFESLVTEVSAQFINLPAEQIDAQIEDAQRRICECLEVDLSALWQWSDSSPHFMTITHLHSPPKGPDRPEGIDAGEAFPWTLEKLLRGEVLVIYTDRMPPEAARDQESRRHFGVESSVNIPLSAGGGPVIGILTFDSLKAERSWPQPIVEKLCLIAQIVTNALTRKRADLQVRESQLRLSMATESAGVGLWVMESNGHVWVTPQTRMLFDFPEDEELDYASFDRMIEPVDRERVSHATQAAIRSDEKLDIDFRVVRLDGSVRWIRALGKRLTSESSHATRLMGVSTDISERKRLEEQLREQIAEISELKQQLEKDNINLRQAIESQHVHKEIVGRSQVMQKILAKVEQVAHTEATVLIEGETGTGKELLARAVHRLSGRKDRPLVTVNCASLPPTLVESELFGREKGAYTGALTRMTGRFEKADGATLFLDEIGELPLDVQAKLLRVLEEGIFERLGSSKSRRVDVRVIAATNQDLARQVDTGKFRKDLYYRLNVFPIYLPSLKERPEDIPALVWTFAKQYEEKMGRRIDRISRQCMEGLQQYDWPGNVRELRNLVERALIVCTNRVLDIPLPRGARVQTASHQSLEDFERAHILSVLEQTGWRLSGKDGAAGVLGLKRTTLQSKMKKLGIRRPEKA